MENLHFHKYFHTPISDNEQLQKITDKIIELKTEFLVTEIKFRNTEWCLKNGSCPTGLITNIKSKYYSEYENEDRKEWQTVISDTTKKLTKIMHNSNEKKLGHIRLQLNELEGIVNTIANKEIINFIEAFSTQKAQEQVQKHVANDPNL